ncbi:UDP-2,3-diacylglucosamine diphosphatase [Myxococcota bacterium]|nr:UDP-2,3-diacylglucosamine diphosphatase [Myxococcota bacterium]MBU1431674.1 UDP-2,3-diacylglucosamine diphosphatase [Myxococcota bacterium]MBU1900019.1 UDP-2,3-diacylglucosamine diphosphatase [Myxococcota bacterium]
MATYFLSDLHFNGDEARRARILRFFKEIVVDAEAVYLVGDVFDFWMGYPSTLYQQHFALLRALAELSEAGVELWIFSGNHDPHLGGFFGEIGARVLTSGRMIPLGKRTAWVEHGDEDDPRGGLRRLAARLVRHPLTGALCRWVHPELLWRVAHLYADHSPPPPYETPLDEALIRDRLASRCAAGADVMITGHFHRPLHLRRTLNQQPCEFICLGDWLTCFTYARLDAQGLRLYRHDQPDPLPIVT